MPVSILSCNIDRKTADLATIKASGIGGSDGTYGGSYKIGYDVRSASICGPKNVITGALTAGPHNLPALWSTYSYQGDTDEHSFAKSYNVTRDLKVETMYYVMVNYEPAEPGEIPDVTNPSTPNAAPIKATVNPLQRAPVFWWDRGVSSKTLNLDINGYPLLNFAGGFHEDLVEDDLSKGLMVVEFPVASTNAFIDISRAYDNAVNSTAWVFKLKTYPPRTVLCKEVSCSPLIAEGQYRYYTVTMRLAFAPVGRTWDTPMPQLGYYYYTKKSDGSFVTDSAGYKLRTTVDYLVPLAPDGTRLPDDQQVVVTNLRVLREYDFNPLTSGSIWNLV